MRRYQTLEAPSRWPSTGIGHRGDELEGEQRIKPLRQVDSLLAWRRRANPAPAGPPQSTIRGLACVCVCVLRDISVAWHHPRSLASSGEERGAVNAPPRGNGARGHAAWCRHMTGVWLPSRSHCLRGAGRGGVCWPGTGHQQLVKLAQGAQSILSHAIVAFRFFFFWQETAAPASVVVSGASPRFPKRQMSRGLRGRSFSDVLP